jgi:RNA polymerase sigma-70 factor (ECF subfamily)
MNSELNRDLIEQFCSGDPTAAEQVFLVLEPYLRMIVRRQLSDRLRAKFDSADVVQSVWVHVLERRRAGKLRLEGPGHLQALLLLEVRHRLIDRLRHFHHDLEREQVMPATDQTDSPLSREPRASELVQADQLWEKMLALCPPGHQELLWLKRQGLSLVEIAARTGLHEGSVRRVFRRLARQLAFPELDER